MTSKEKTKTEIEQEALETETVGTAEIKTLYQESKEKEYETEGAVGGELQSGRDVRRRSPTERGAEFTLVLRRRNLKQSITKWRRVGNKAWDAIADADNAETLKQKREEMTAVLDEVEEASMKFLEVSDMDEMPIDHIQIEAQALRKELNTRIKEFKDQDTISRKSHRTRQSGRSQSGKSTRSMKLEEEAKAAELKVKLRYHEQEMAAEAAAEKMKIEKELEIAKARLQVIKEESSVGGSVFKDLFDEEPSDLKVKRFIDSLPPVHNLPITTSVTSTLAHDMVTTVGTAVTAAPTCSTTNTIINTFVTAPRLLSTPALQTQPLNPNATPFSMTTTLVGCGGYTPSYPQPVMTTRIESTFPDVRNVKTKPDLYNDLATTPGVECQPQMFHATKDSSTQALESMTRLMKKPPSSIDKFDGDSLQYRRFIRQFNSYIGAYCENDLERLTYLEQFTTGEAHRVVMGYSNLDSHTGFAAAMRELNERYGDEETIANAYVQKAVNWPLIKYNDVKALDDYSIFLRECLHAAGEVGTLGILEYQNNLKAIVERLPHEMHEGWRTVVERKRRTNEKPKFKDLVDFVSFDAGKARHAIYGRDALKCSTDKDNTTKVKRQNRPPNKSSETRCLSTKAENENKETKNPEMKPDSKPALCISCSGKHNLDFCKDFQQKPLEERQKFAKSKGMCFGCLECGHLNKNCQNRKTCRECQRRHPTVFHDFYLARQQLKAECSSDTGKHNESKEQTKPKEPETVVSFCMKGTESKACAMVVPVYVSHEQNPLQEELVYALLDTQSDTSFVSNNVCKALGVKGVDSHLQLSTMALSNKLIDCRKVTGLTVRGHNNTMKIKIPKAYTQDSIPMNREHIASSDTARSWKHLEHIAHDMMPKSNCEIGLLIGYNCPQALMPREVIPAPDKGPYAVKTDLGWSIVGTTSFNEENNDLDACESITTHRILTKETVPEIEDKNNVVTFAVKTTKFKEVFNPNEIIRVLESDFIERKQTDKKPMSYDDRKFIDILSEGIHVRDDQHYEMPLPFKEPHPKLPNNIEQAEARLMQLKRKLSQNEKFRSDYTSFMNEIIDKGYAERVPDDKEPKEGQVFYIPHHGVYHPRKPDQIRVVFDCSSKFQNVSLNDVLLQGPDMTNDLVAVLCRFRKEPVAIACDVQKMFYQFHVNEEDRDYLRFLWWEQGDITTIPKEYRMTVHLFGAVSSPACANFGLKRAADDGRAEFGDEATKFLKDDFYVDDGLTAVSTSSDAIDLIKNTKAICQNKGIRLHKFVSNDPDVITAIPEEDRAKCISSMNLGQSEIHVERVLGIQWSIDLDSFQFRIKLKDRPATRRGILSTVSSVYDPLGFLSPVILKGKQILQEICKEQCDWDDPLRDDIVKKWREWCSELMIIETLLIPRCIKPDGIKVKHAEIHHFSDASSLGYGECSYIRLIDVNDKIHCTLLFAKARVTPLKQVSIPRLELTAALLSVKIGAMLKQDMKFDDIDEYYWSDSKVVLGYIANNARRFHIYVANRVQQIRDLTKTDQWNYVQTNDNPADLASRGLSAENLVNSSMWFSGPDFLQRLDWQVYIEQNPIQKLCSSDDPELKKATVLTTQSDASKFDLVQRLSYFSNWYRAKKAVALCRKYIQILRNRINKTMTPVNSKVSVNDLREAEMLIIKSVQRNAFSSDMLILEGLEQSPDSDRSSEKERKAKLKKTSKISRLDPFIDPDGLLRVGGRIKADSIDKNVKHPLLLPKNDHISQLIIGHCHERTNHQGRGITMNELRSSGYWIVGMSSSVAHYIKKCVVCRKWRGSVIEQKMADLPNERTEEVAPFTYCAVDLFGPFTIKEGRKELKRYGVLFTCLTSRAIHIETSIDLTTDSFLNALRRFISIRGPIRELRSDQGTNFVGAQRELLHEAARMNQKQINQFLTSYGCDWFEFKMNVPAASHMGGVWERQIRTVRSVLTTLLEQSGTQLDDEALRTLLHEAAAIVNSRPLTTDNINDPTSLEPLTPNHLLTMKSRIILPPPGEFQRTDLYSRKRWRRVQYLANVFWTRWRTEYLSSLQARQKWLHPKRDIQKGDIVLLKDENQPRNCWSLCLIEDTYPSACDNRVRKVKLRVGDPLLDKRGKRKQNVSFLDRPVQKIVLLLENETGASPPKEP